MTRAAALNTTIGICMLIIMLNFFFQLMFAQTFHNHRIILKIGDIVAFAAGAIFLPALYIRRRNTQNASPATLPR
jgi:hypothetical protein